MDSPVEIILTQSVCVCVYRSGQLIEPLYQVWEELADTELLPIKTGQQVRKLNRTINFCNGK